MLMLAELKLAFSDWTEVIPAVATELIAGSLDRVGCRADGIARTPLVVMTGRRPNHRVLQVVPSETSPLQARTVPLARAQQVLNIYKLQMDLNNLQSRLRHDSISVMYAASPPTIRLLILLLRLSQLEI